jgi:hypothetical protein
MKLSLCRCLLAGLLVVKVEMRKTLLFGISRAHNKMMEIFSPPHHHKHIHKKIIHTVSCMKNENMARGWECE